jgi:hypothetical protein
VADHQYLVCAPALEMSMEPTPGSIYTHKCSVCLEHVCVARSGQFALAQQPELEIICTKCAAKQMKPGDNVNISPSAMQEAIRYWAKNTK